MKQTPLQKAYELLNDKEQSFIGNRMDAVTSANAEGFKQGLIWALSTIESLLPYERDVIEEAYMSGGYWDGPPQPRFEIYFTKTFNTDEQ